MVPNDSNGFIYTVVETSAWKNNSAHLGRARRILEKPYGAIHFGNGVLARQAKANCEPTHKESKKDEFTS